MYPIVHNYDAIDFRSQGFGSLSDCISAEVSEELNGAYTLELTYPLNGLHSEYLVAGNIIVAKPNHNQSRQPFRISEVKKSFSNNIQVYANHICYDLSGFPVRSSHTYNSLAATIQGMNSLAASMATPAASLMSFQPFTFSTDMTSSVSFSMEAIQTLRAWMGGQDGSIINVYGGEWAYDNFNCFLTSRRGQDTGYRISYGKNLEEYEKERTYTEYSHVCAYWKKSEVVAYSEIVPTGIDCSFRCGYVDASSAYENQPSTSQLNAYARSAVGSMGFGAQTVTVTPAQIGNDIIGIGDSVLICYETVFQTRVIKTVWDVLAGAYKTLQLGTRKANITDTIKSLSTAPSGTGGSSPIAITVDDALSTVSTNPVQNRIITNALNNKVSAESGKGLSTNDFTTAEKDKLAGIASGAEVNQNAFGNVKVGSTTIAADSETDTLELIAGNNITLTPSASGDSVTIEAVSGSAPADYVIEVGTSGMWTFRKWYSGIAECWGTSTLASGAFTKADSIYFRTTGRLALPTDLFVSDPIINVTVKHISIAMSGLNYSNSSQVDATASSQNATARDVTLYYQVIGRWK